MTPVFWAFQSIETRAGEAILAGPEAVLGPAELAFFQRLRFRKRQLDWLGARLLAKDLLRAADARLEGLPLGALEVLNDPSGAPYAQVAGERRDDLAISLSHAHGQALAAFSPQPGRLGADLEWVEPRDPAFAADFFTPAELAQVLALPAEQRALGETVIWSAKEAVLKALRTGLRADTRAIDIDLSPSLAGADGWMPLPYRSGLMPEKTPRLVWRGVGSFVVTVCSEQELVRRLE